MKQILKTAFVAVSALCCLNANSVSANAATVDDCAAVARSYGVSETAIQSAYNAYYANPDQYTAEDFDMVIETLHIYGNESDALINEYFGISSDSGSTEEETIPTEEETVTPEEETVPTENTDSAETGVSSDSGNSSSGNSTYTPPIESADFINMTMDEKVEFVNSLPEAERAEFVSNLSLEEKNSIIKGFSVEDKTEILSKFAEAGEAMGLNFTIDEITDDSVSMSIRNQDGNLVDQSSLGVIVEDTGYDYTTLFTAVTSAILISSAGIYLIFRKISKEEKNNE